MQRHRLCRFAAATLIALMASAAFDARAAPDQPCAEAAAPSYGAVDGAPNVQVWHAGEAPGGLGPGACSLARAWRSTLMIALAGRFSFRGDAFDLALRFGAISTLPGISYWSVTDARWQTLILDAAAVSDAEGHRPRDDFNLAEMRNRDDLYFDQTDNRSSGRVVYRMKVRQLSADRLVIAMQNVSVVTLFILPLFDPGDLQSLYVLQRQSPGVWGFYSLTGVRAGMLASEQPASYINRAVAIYRHILGIPTDRDPPAAP